MAFLSSRPRHGLFNGWWTLTLYKHGRSIVTIVKFNGPFGGSLEDAPRIYADGHVERDVYRWTDMEFSNRCATAEFVETLVTGGCSLRRT